MSSIILTRKDRLVGAQLIGDIQTTGTLNWLIRLGQPISRLGLGSINQKSKRNRVVPDYLRYSEALI